jgi:hypothetical protein
MHLDDTQAYEQSEHPGDAADPVAELHHPHEAPTLGDLDEPIVADAGQVPDDGVATAKVGDDKVTAAEGVAEAAAQLDEQLGAIARRDEE